MRSVAIFLILGTLALSAGSEVTSDAVQLECAASRRPDGRFLYKVTSPLTSDKWDSSWQMKDGTKIAHYPDYNQTLVEGLTNHSITTSQCLGFLLFLRKEWNQTEGPEHRRLSEAVCEVNCSALMLTPDPRPIPNTHPNSTISTNSNNSTNSTDPLPMGCHRVDWLTIGLSVVAVVVLAVLLLLYVKKWFTNKKKEKITQLYTEVELQPFGRDPEIMKPPDAVTITTALHNE